MINVKTWRERIVILGFVFSFIYILSISFLSDIPKLQNFELSIKDALIKNIASYNSISLSSDKQVTLIDFSDAENYQLNSDSSIYSNLVNKIIEAEARVILLDLPYTFTNAPSSFSTVIDSQISPISKLIRKNDKKIVLTAKAFFAPAFSPLGDLVLPIYNQYFSFNSQTLEPLIKSPQNIEGFFEFFPDFSKINSKAINLNPTHYSYCPVRSLRRKDSIKESDHFKSAVYLAFNKFIEEIPQKSLKYWQVEEIENRCLLFEQKKSSPKETFLLNWFIKPEVQMNFWNSNSIFKTIKLDKLCKPASSNKISAPVREITLEGEAQESITDDSSPYKNLCDQPTGNQELELLKGKIVLIGFAESDPNFFKMLSPFGALSAEEMQANLLASMMTNSFFYVVSDTFSLVIVALGSLLVVSLTALGFQQSVQWYIKLGALTLAVPSIYILVVLLVLWQSRLLLPIALPVLTWLGIGVSIIISILLWKYWEHIEQQNRVVMEREAILRKALKLLERVALDIHSGPLQEIKAIMDQLEELELEFGPLALRLSHNSSNSNSGSVVDRLSSVAYSIRNQLNDMLELSNKHEFVSPVLNSGLDQGIKSRLQHLIETGQLRLNSSDTSQDVSKLEEPYQNILWIDAREDIFRFFDEAITNVMKHAQPPHGSSTYVLVSLKQQGTECTLVIENDGSKLKTLPKEGTGTNAMKTIASALPNGSWNRTFLNEGGVRVVLSWSMMFD